MNRSAAFAVLAVAALVACAPVAAPPPETFYRLAPVSTEQSHARPPLRGVIEVGSFSGDGLTGQRSLVYAESDRPGELRLYSYHMWAQPPGEMLRERLVEALRAANLAETVVTPALRAQPDFILLGHVKRFEQIGPGAVAEVEFSLTNRDGDVMLVKTYEATHQAADLTASAAVAAMDQAVAEIVTRLLADLAALGHGA
ncbi:ABC-type transport auxiliary lipoprotein family protein [Telmatospirillum sp. J64-1]|uniref:ABC-type transport auxiliary lipoprotein family protein n=1 Tax=Telmatospirillum sp. J64-1 TaxID=2502183 RepID=UPI00163DB2D4|nr:ABC-type transport auxiliary lipoprotein family protein [Telmatospirillum sp. J64-1]